MKIYSKLMDRAILQAHNDELNDYGVLIEMYREYREKRRKEHKRKVTERELQLEFFYLYSEKIKQECKGIIDNYNYKLEIRKPPQKRGLFLLYGCYRPVFGKNRCFCCGAHCCFL